MKYIFYALVLLCTLIAKVSANDTLSSTVTFKSAFFSEEATTGEDRPQLSSLTFKSELFLDFHPKVNVVIAPNFYYEHLSEERQHFDLREFILNIAGSNWDLRFGLGQEFWGVTESRHVVDVIGQSDFSADFSGDEKLGQPMINASWYTDYGNFGIYILPLFREAEFASSDHRPRLPIVLDTDLTTYESDKEEKMPDVALRWDYNLRSWDVGLHLFSGTDRTPQILATETGELFPRYRLMSQFGIDTQLTLDALLLKLETIYRVGDEIIDHAEVATGLEYTFSRIFGSEMSFGILLEYLHDDRDEEADHPFENDVMAGVRLAFNDINSSSFLLTTITDVESNSSFVEATLSTRIGPNFTLDVAGEWWSNTDEDESINAFRNEDNIELGLSWRF